MNILKPWAILCVIMAVILGIIFSPEVGAYLGIIIFIGGIILAFIYALIMGKYNSKKETEISLHTDIKEYDENNICVSVNKISKNYLSYISAYNKPRGIANLNGDPDLLDFEILKRIEGIHVNDFFDIWPYWGKEKTDDLIEKFLADGLIYETTGIEGVKTILAKKTMKDLRKIINEYGLPAAKSKDETMSRLIYSVSADDLVERYGQYSVYKMTESGKRRLKELKEYKEEKYIKMLEKSVSLLKQREINQAYKLIAQFKSEEPLYSGLGIDWDKRYREGLVADEINTYQKIIGDSLGENFELHCICIVAEFLGRAFHTVIKQYYKKILHSIIDDETIERAVTEVKRVKFVEEIEDYKKTDIKYYRILGANDEKICDVCKEQNGRVYKVSNAVSGINLPPFCTKCRCDIVAVFDD